jgi:MFS family permease
MIICGSRFQDNPIPRRPPALSAPTLLRPPAASVAPNPPWLLPRLALLLFSLFAVPGAFVPLFSTHLEELGFTPLESGWCYATAALGCLAAPVVAQVADRWLAAERCVALCSLTAGSLLWLLPATTHPLGVFALALGTWVVLVPAITLSASLSFAQLPNPQRDYGRVRLWGTFGWVMPGLLLAVWFAGPPLLEGFRAWLRPDGPARDTADIFRLAGFMAFLTAGYALTLPPTPPARRPTSGLLAPLAALRLLRKRAFAVYWATSLGLYVSISFNSQVTPLLLRDLGIPLDWRSATLTLGQSLEVVTLLFLPMLLLRLGLRGTMLLGLGAWVAMLAVLTAGAPTWLVVASLGCAGVCVTCFLVAGQLFVNSRAAGDLRASAQGLLTFGNGLGQLIGHVLVGVVRQVFDRAFAPTFAVALAIAVVLGLTFLAGFRERRPRPAG